MCAHIHMIRLIKTNHICNSRREEYWIEKRWNEHASIHTELHNKWVEEKKISSLERRQVYA